MRSWNEIRMTSRWKLDENSRSPETTGCALGTYWDVLRIVLSIDLLRRWGDCTPSNCCHFYVAITGLLSLLMSSSMLLRMGSMSEIDVSETIDSDFPSPFFLWTARSVINFF